MQRLLSAGVRIAILKSVRVRFVSGEWFNCIPVTTPVSFGFRLAPACAAGQ
ncbi:hypothetical protein HGP14_25655 [Rhizobium sp. P32RR-XVIII]|uniref:hypothetical protein n=1 Tax=Rhizobium sp. P32RR-XVIII TaxID=2726738 RepID=UPI001457492D|nr:hypothetical protein [Rhizobium sp. P32RR-XVIII]NLS06700.1 hypothetical protein [Rhizobium sp. P32RR-XVIII]